MYKVLVLISLWALNYILPNLLGDRVRVVVEHESGCELGESPFWDHATRTLLYIDITQSTVHRWDPETQKDTSVKIAEPSVGTVIRRQKGGLVVAAGRTFSYLDESTGDLQPIATIPSQCTACALNDGKCDSQGRLWSGLYQGDIPNFVPDSGYLYSLDPATGAVATKESGVSLTNGMSWSPDDTIMYYTDTLKGIIYGYDFDAVSGSISNRRIVVTFDASEGLPDGHTIDTDGNLWVAMNGGGAIVKVDAMTGEKLEKVEIDGVPGVTACTFGGLLYDELYVTTARNSQPIGSDDVSGALFKITGLGVRGFPGNMYNG